jgi:uncharacterized membrane protein
MVHFSEQGGGFPFTFIVGVFLGYISTVVGSYFVKEVFVELGELLSDNLFSLAGKLIFWGAVLMALLFGALIMWVGWVVATVAFFRQRTREEIN